MKIENCTASCLCDTEKKVIPQAEGCLQTHEEAPEETVNKNMFNNVKPLKLLKRTPRAKVRKTSPLQRQTAEVQH